MLCTGGGKNTRTARTPVAAAVAGCAAVNRGGNEGVCSRITEKSSCKEPPGPEDLVECSEIDLKDSMNHCVPNWEMENGMMPSPEFLPMAKSNWDTAQQKRSFLPEHEIEELLWENGTVVNKVIKRPLPNQLCKILQNDDAVLPGKPSVPGKDNILESVVHDMAATNASSSIHEDEMASWLHYPLDDSLEKEYCSDFFGGMPSTNVHMLRDSVGAQVNHVPTERVSNLQVQKGSCLPNDNNSLPWTGVFASMANTANTAGSSITGKDSGPKAVNSDKAMALGAGRASGLISQPGANAFAKVRTTTQLPVSKWHTNVQPSCNSEDSQSPCQKSATHSVSLLAMPPPKTQAPDLGSVKADKVRLVNFSHFSRPAATMKANLQSIGSVSGLSTIEISNRLDKFREDGNASAETSVIESTTSDMTTIASSSATNNQIQDIGHCQTCQNPPQRKSTDAAIAACSEDITASSAKAPESVSCQTLNVGRNLASGGVEKCGDAGDVPEPTITSSSGGSGNSAGRMGKETTHTSKRKSRDVDESECQSEDIEYESVDAKKQVPPRTTSKRSRAAEVHNQSERRRRDRINEKMRALQELIPHCNKSDKASMLDEAIEYLKTLQLQVQIMSMGGGMGLSPMMYTGGMQPFQVPQMAHLAPMGMGIGMGMGYSMGMLDMGATSGRPVMPLPAMHVSPLPASTICPAPMPLSGMPGPSFPIPRIPVSGIQVSGLPVSTLPVSGFSGTAQPVLVSTSASTSTDLQDQTQNTNVIDPYKFYLSRQQMQLAPQAMNGNLYSGPLAPSTPQNPTQSSGRVIPNAESSGRVIPNAEPRTGNQGTGGKQNG